MSKPEATPKQETMVKARKAARVAFALFILGGAVLFLYGLYSQWLPTIYEGLVLLAGSALPLFLSYKIQKKLDENLV